MTSPYMDTYAVAEFLLFRDPATGGWSRKRAHEYLQRMKVPHKKRGRVCLYHREDVEATLVPVERKR